MHTFNWTDRRVWGQTHIKPPLDCTSTHNYITWPNEGLPFGTVLMPMTPTPTPRAAISLQTTTIFSPLSIAFHALSNNLWAQPSPLLHQKTDIIYINLLQMSKCQLWHISLRSWRLHWEFRGSSTSWKWWVRGANPVLETILFPAWIFSFTSSVVRNLFHFKVLIYIHTYIHTYIK